MDGRVKPGRGIKADRLGVLDVGGHRPTGLQALEQMPAPALVMFLRVADRADHKQRDDDKSGDDVLHHGCHSRDRTA